MANSLIAKPFGSTGLEISPLGLGTVKVGRNENVKNACADGFELPSDALVEDLLDICIENGVNLLDTAPAYGIAEERLGLLMKHRRDKFVLMTKVGESFKDGVSSYDFSYEGTVKSVENSLRLLKTDVLEGVMVHCDHSELEILKNPVCLEALQMLKERGDIQSYGWSSLSIEGGLKALELTDMVMVSINPSYTAEIEVVEQAAEMKKGIFIKKGLLQGHLNKLEGDAVQYCMDYAAGLPGDVCVVAGTLNPEHLKSNISKAVSAFNKG